MFMLSKQDIEGSCAGPRALAAPAAVEPLARLRQKLASLDRHQERAAQTCLPLGAPEIEAHLPAPGLAGGVLHEIAGATHGDRPAAFGLVLALMAIAGSYPSRHRYDLSPSVDARGLTPVGPAFLVTSRRALSHFGRPYGHGLGQAGLDPCSLVIVETRSDKEALWALEEVLRSGARPCVVAGAIEAFLGLTESRRLNLAAARFGTPLLVLGAPGRPGTSSGTSAAATRWRVAAAPAARDRFGALDRPRWRVALERCRHGRPGQWIVEWDHAAYRFSVAEGVADRAPAAGARPKRTNWRAG
jgi:protein ImuA